MKPHVWSKPLPVFENISGYKCKNCGALVIDSGEEYVGPSDVDLTQQKLPIDCDVAIATVIHEEYDNWDERTWEESDFQKYEWP